MKSIYNNPFHLKESSIRFIKLIFLFLLIVQSATAQKKLKIWYKANEPYGVAKGCNPGRVAWGHNPKAASWDMVNGFWWEDKYNNQEETDKLLSQTLISLTGKTKMNKAWNALFTYFNKEKHNKKKGYKAGEKIAVKINQNNATSQEDNGEINSNPTLILSLLRSLVYDAGVPQNCITIADPSRFITNNIYDKCSKEFPDVHYVDNVGGNGREKATYQDKVIPFSVDNGKVAQGIAECFINADYIIDMALMKGHNSQGVTLSAKNYFGCLNINSNWHKNAHSSGFSQDRHGKYRYSIYPDFMGHKYLGGKTFLFLIDGIYGNKYVNGKPKYPWKLTPFNGHWPCSLFASQDGVAVDSVVLDFALAEWPDAPDMMYSDYYLIECALAGNNPPSGVEYDPERDGIKLQSLGITEHWNNPIDKMYKGNKHKGKGIQLVYKLVE